MNPDVRTRIGQSACPLATPGDATKAADPTAGAPTVADLVTAEGRATLRAHDFDGERLHLRGYVAPSLVSDPVQFLLTEGSLAPCMLCGCVHGSGVGLQVASRVPPDSDLGMTERVDAVGRLWVAPPTRSSFERGNILLADAVVERAPVSKGVGDARRWLRKRRQGGDGNAQAHQASRALPRSRTAPTIEGLARPADVILRGGVIHTVDEAFSTAEAVAIRKGRFVAVGDNDSVMTHAGPETEIIDLRGKVVVPGLIDSHLHQIYVAINIPTVDLLQARSIADVQEKIAARVTSTPSGEWVVASSGWHESILAEGRLPTRWELDEVAPANPVIIPRGGHVVTVNSLALERAGITDATPDPTGGVIVRDPATGAATGVLLETAAYFARRVAPPLPAPDVMMDRLKAAMAELNSYGIVGVIDPVVDENSIEVYRRLRDADGATVRTDLLYKAVDKAQTDKGIAAMRAGTSDDMLRYVGLKFMLDGGVEGARLREPYRIVPGEQPHEDYHGLLMLPPGGEDEFVEALVACAEAGLQVQTHGVGDEAIDVIMRAYARANDRIAFRDLNWAVMHVFLPSDEAIAAMKDIGVVATVQDHPVLLGHNQRRWWGDERAAAAIPIRTLIDAGLLVGGGSDGPIVPVDPFLSMWWMVTRETLSDYALGEEEAISAEEALQLYTVNNARIMGVESDRGSIEPGKLADLAILSQDILSVPPEAIKDTKALLTMVGGEVVYRDGI